MHFYKSLDLLMITAVCWCLFFGYWVIAAQDTKKTIYRQGLWGRVMIIIRVISSFTLLYLPALSVSWLAYRVFPGSLAIKLAGTCVCISGLLVAIWARRTLGVNWSGTITLKENHKLIQQGPYRWVRHPIYSGLLLAWFGSALTLGEVRGVVALLLTFYGLWGKLQEEESLMLQQFPAEYPKYKERVKALIPFIL